MEGRSVTVEILCGKPTHVVNDLGTDPNGGERGRLYDGRHIDRRDNVSLSGSLRLGGRGEDGHLVSDRRRLGFLNCLRLNRASGQFQTKNRFDGDTSSRCR